MLRTISLLIVLLMWPMGTRAAQGPGGPSFACGAAATPVEQAICRDPALAAADRTMARLYAETRISAFGNGPSNLLASQRAWLKLRDGCLGVEQRGFKTHETCLADRYATRNAELAVAALFVDTPLALETLRKADPAVAPLYEAFQLYAAQPQGANWASPGVAAQGKRLLALLTPQFDDLRDDDDRSYGRDILKDGGITRAEDAVRSDKNFTDAFKVLAAYAEEPGQAFVIPCAAVVRRPALLAATEPVFGSLLDTRAPVTDCDTMLPALPRLDVLVERIFDKWPQCDGTIRYAAYKSFDVRVDSARIGLALSESAPRATPARRLSGVAPATVEGAIAELSIYYQRYRRAPATKARLAAGEAIAAIMAAGHECD